MNTKGSAGTCGIRQRLARVAFTIALVAVGGSEGSAGDAVHLARDGKAELPIVVSAAATHRTRKAASTLAEYLRRISGAQFDLVTAEPTAGIVVGVASDFPDLALQPPWQNSDVSQREDYLLRSTPDRLLVLGATEAAVSHAVWDLLYRLGYRQFFPGPTWEVVPNVPDLSIAVDAHEHPAYRTRRIWYGWGISDYNKEPYADWCAKNRTVSAFELNTGHAYDGIIKRNKAIFDAHPEYLGLVGGERKSSKFCISNADLRRLVVEDALRQLQQRPHLDSISVDPSDGGGWCECDGCATLGSITDRVILLANEVAAAVTDQHPGKVVGIYAYNYHSMPPNIAIHPAVVVSVATAFIKGDIGFEELLRAWSATGATLGIREYYSVNTWDRDLPAAARGGNLRYLAATIPSFHAQGARFMSAEASDNWAPNGLGYYLAARVMWKLEDAARVSELVEDFLDRAFGPAKEPMREFYNQLNSAKSPADAADQPGRMFRALAKARRLARTPEVKARIGHLVLYSHYVLLYQRYANADGAARQQAFEALLRHSYRMRTTMMIHSKALYRDLPNRDRTVEMPAEAQWSRPEPANPWKSSAAFSDRELEQMVRRGLREKPATKRRLEPVAFGDNLVSAQPLNLPDAPRGRLGSARGTQVFHTRVTDSSIPIRVAVTAAREGDAATTSGEVELWKVGGTSESGELEMQVDASHELLADGNEHMFELTPTEPGLYRVVVESETPATVYWRCDLPCTVESSASDPMNARYRDLWQMYFYVPKGTKRIGLIGGEHGEIRDSHGRVVFWLNGRERKAYSFAVPAGQDGKLWSIRYGRGSVQLLTVPPYFAARPAELLLPHEVVEKDAAR